MVKDAPDSVIPPDTFVEADNWEELQQKGLVHCTNIFDYTGYMLAPRMDLEIHRTRLILQWEVGEGRLFEGWLLLEKKPSPPEEPHPFFGPRDDVGFYILPPEEGWTSYWNRLLYSDHPAIQAAGISSLLEPDTDIFEEYKPTWEIWTVFGSEDRFRCWGPSADPDTKCEGTLDEVIAHIKTYEAEHKDDL